jgi:hypothetical protein
VLELLAVATEIGEGFDLDHIKYEAFVYCTLAALMADLRYYVFTAPRIVDGDFYYALDDCLMIEVVTVLVATLPLAMVGPPILSCVFSERTNSYEWAALIATP